MKLIPSLLMFSTKSSIQTVVSMSGEKTKPSRGERCWGHIQLYNEGLVQIVGEKSKVNFLGKWLVKH